MNTSRYDGNEKSDRQPKDFIANGPPIEDGRMKVSINDISKIDQKDEMILDSERDLI